MKAADYDRIAKYYDNVIGKGYDSTDYIKRKILRYNKNAGSILELGCGTGNNLQKLRKDFKVSGTDISKEMLKIAKNKVKGCSFYLQDIRDFDLMQKFDVIVCLYDTINHLLLLNEWKKLFRNAATHLNEKGLFIFDINTIVKLDYISAISPLVYKFEKSYLISDIKMISGNTYNWNMKIFENKKGNDFTLLENNIKESSFPTERIKSELEKYFVTKGIEDENGKKAKAETDRIFFVCQKR